jgi:hypothetical protein
VKEFTGERNGVKFSLGADDDGDVLVSSESCHLFPYIPNIRWTPVVEKPEAVSGDRLILPYQSNSAPCALGNHIAAFREKWPGNVRVTWKVEAVD